MLGKSRDGEAVATTGRSEFSDHQSELLGPGTADNRVDPAVGGMRGARDAPLVPDGPSATQELVVRIEGVAVDRQVVEDAGADLAGEHGQDDTDTPGLLPAVTVTTASVHDSAAGTPLLAEVRQQHPTITKA
ncbi:hypothetical protein ASE09_10850 [Streptomyces sp. Root66D1]|nr:hypothetical protein ASD33_10845 [Streptomyces sp. Root1304]KRA84735.1 hypothetical protein ASE09_10850 [Streptomyces sp. Root66D1]